MHSSPQWKTVILQIFSVHIKVYINCFSYFHWMLFFDFFSIRSIPSKTLVMSQIRLFCRTANVSAAWEEKGEKRTMYGDEGQKGRLIRQLQCICTSLLGNINHNFPRRQMYNQRPRTTLPACGTRAIKQNAYTSDLLKTCLWNSPHGKEFFWSQPCVSPLGERERKSQKRDGTLLKRNSGE